MRERHFLSGDKHPRACTCAECHRKRLQAIEDASRLKKRKPKSQRGQAVSKKSSKRNQSDTNQESAGSNAVDEAMRILGIDPAVDDSAGPDTD
jgi:hypothetical protein